MNPRPRPRGSATSLKGKALQYLSQREHSRKELAQKLRRWLEVQAQAQARTDAVAPNTAGSRFDASDETQQAIGPAELSARVDELLNGLAEEGLLSDTRFTESRVHARRTRFGNRRIEQELKQHGLAATAEQQEQLRHSEAERAWAVLRGRCSRLNADRPLSDPQRQKIQRFLLGRGFTSEAIRQALRQLGSPTDPKDDE